MRYQKKDANSITAPENQIVHKLQQGYDDVKRKRYSRWVRVKLGKRAYAAICDFNISTADICDKFRLSPPEVTRIRGEYSDAVRSTEAKVREKSIYEQYQEDVWSSYEELPLGQTGPRCKEPYLYIGEDRVLVSDERPAKMTHNFHSCE